MSRRWDFIGNVAGFASRAVRRTWVWVRGQIFDQVISSVISSLTGVPVSGVRDIGLYAWRNRHGLLLAMHLNFASEAVSGVPESRRAILRSKVLAERVVFVNYG